MPTTSTLLHRHGRWYIAGRDPRWLRRNALVVLGNVGDGADERTVATLARYRDGGDDVLAEHARWASDRLGLVAPPARRPVGVKHLLVTNDFPPKIGGIQSLLWEWWRRLPPESFAVLTSPYAGAAEFDAEQPFRVERVREPVLLPHPLMVRRINALADEIGASLVVLDPAVPLGLVGPSLRLPYDVVVHGAEVTVPGRLPGTRQALGAVLRGARHIVSAGEYAAREAERAAGRALPITVVPPGVDVERFRPLSAAERGAARARFDIPADAELVVSISRLVPRKGFDVAIRAVAALAPTRPRLLLAIAGSGRDERRLRRLVADLGAPVRFLGRVAHDDLPLLYGCADLFTMACRHAVGRARAGGLRHRVRRGGGMRYTRRSPATPAVPPRRSSTASPAASSPGRNGGVTSPRRSTSCSTTTIGGRRCRRRRAERAITEFSYDVLARRLGESLGVYA